MSRALACLPIGAALSVAALLRLWNLGQNGYSREYYAAAVLSMLDSWHNTFFNSFDPGGFVSLDKPPVAIWVQALYAKFLGFSALNSLLPQVALGLLAVILVYFLVRRTFGELPAGLAALFLALTPASVAVDRSNNTESCLIVVLLLAAWLAMRAAESGRLLYLCGAMLMLGIGFNIKMAAALIIAPAFAIVFFLYNRQISFLRHVKYQAIAGSLMVALALSWAVAFDLTPADKRPYAGSTKHNSMLELALLHNGAARFTHAVHVETKSEKPRPVLYDESPTGPSRLFRAVQAGQAAWLLPFALLGIYVSLFWRDATRVQQIAIAIWTGWLVSYWIVFSAAGGPFHTYYLAALAPPLAALAAIGASEVWRRYKDASIAVWIPIAAIISTMLWQAWIFSGQTLLQAPSWLNWIAAGAAVVVLLSALPILARKALAIAPAVALAALLSLPLLASLSVVFVRPNVAAPVATLAAYFDHEQFDALRANPRRAEPAREKLIAFLKEQRRGEKFLVAVENALLAGPIIVATGEPVAALGGYLGNDPILTPEALAKLGQSGALRFVMIGGFTLSKRDSPSEIALREWVQKNAARVDPKLWSLAPNRAGQPFQLRVGGALVEFVFPELYDLRSLRSR